MDLPEEVGYGTITGRILVAVRDEDDLNLAPDGAPVRGQAIFTPSIDYATVDSATTGPQTIAFAPIIGVFDDQGYLSTPHPNSGQVMYRGLNLVATDDPDLSVTGWTWKVTYQLEAVAGKKLVIPEHSFEVPVGASLDLAELVPVPSTPGYGLPQAEAAALRAEAVAQSVRDDADSGLFNGTAATIAVGTVTNGLNPSVTNSGTESHAVLNFVLAKGDKGDTGVGLPDAGTPLQVMRMAESGAQTEWVSPDKNMVGLGNVDNTTDLGKPVSNATQSALNLKASTSDLTAGLLAKADLQSGKVPVTQLPTDALVTDANVAAVVDGAQTGPAIDQRINTQVTPLVQPIVADYIASSQVVVDAAAAAVDSNPKIVEIVEGAQITTGAHLDTIIEPGKKYQPNNANAKLDLGYPIERAGVLNVDQWGYSDGPLLMEQYWPYNYEGMFFRPIYYESKTWKEIPTKVAVQAMLDASGIQPATSSRTSVVAIGDSLTAGYSNGAAWGSAEKWPTILDTLLPGATVTNEGFTGHLIDGTMITIGAHKPRFTIPGGTIPASGASVAVATNQVYGIPQGISAGGTLAGVLGVLDHTNGGGFTFRSLNGASATGITGIHEFKANRQGTWETKTAIIWLGRNDISNSTTGMESTVPDHIVASTKRLVAELTPRVKQIMICGVTTRTTEESGSPQHAWVTETNDRLRELFPEYFKSAQDYWRDEALADLGITPTATDTAKIAAGTIPPSIMDDETHPSKALANAMARYFFHPFLTGKGYVD